MQLAAGQFSVVAPDELLERTQPDHVVHFASLRIQATEHRKRLAHGQEILERRLLELDAGLGAKSRAQWFAAIEHAPGSRHSDAFHDLHCCRLAGAIRSEQAEADALWDLERHAVDGAYAGVLLDEILDLDHGFHEFDDPI